MSGDVHVRTYEHLGGWFPGVTQLENFQKAAELRSSQRSAVPAISGSDLLIVCALSDFQVIIVLNMIC